MGLLEYLLKTEETLIRIQQRWENIMATAKSYEDLVAKLNTATTTLGTRIQELVEKAKGGGLTEAEEDANLAALDQIGDQLIAMGQDQNNPVPPVTT